MILEVADFRTASAEDFEAAMRELAPVIASSAGYLGHTVQRSIETPGRYLLIVRWTSVEAHTKGFRASPAFERWRTRLGDHRNGAVVEHFETLVVNDWSIEP
jgi:heme-degrading monooxygenase HmoA